MKRTLLGGILLAFVSPCWAQAPDTDAKLLQSIGLKTDGPSLLEYFKQRTFKEANPGEVAKLITMLGDDSFHKREKAQKDLLQLGQTALVGLKLAENNPDTEVRSRVVEIRALIQAKVEPTIQAATARLIGVSKPAGAADVVLAYLPFAADQHVIDELCNALSAVAVRNGKGEEAVIKSLTDPLPLKRMAAAEALVRGQAKDQYPTIRKMLADPEPPVRLRVALALASSAKEKEALPVLVELMAVLNPDQLWPAEELLLRLAGTDVPAVSLGDSPETRKKCRDAWSAWLTKNNDKIDLAKLDQVQSLLGFTLVVQHNLNRIGPGGVRMPQKGEVLELDALKRPRWRFDVPTYPVDAQVIRQDRVLVAEYHGQRVSERDFTGKVLWEQGVGGNPIGVQGLPNDHVFVVMQNRLVEYDRNHKEVFSHNRPNHDIFRARKVRNGDVVYVTNAGLFTRMEGATQKVIKTFHVGNIPVLFGSIDILPSGGVIIPDFQQNRVVEFDAEGKQVAQFHVQWPNSVMRLPNGNTLVGSQNTRRVIEFDRNGQEVWNYNAEGMVFNTRKR